MPMRKHLARLLRKVGWLDFDLVAVKPGTFQIPAR
jgi:hypothetical protein